MIGIDTVVTVVMVFIAGAVVFSLLWGALALISRKIQGEAGQMFITYGQIFLILAAVFVIIGLIMHLIGHPIIRF